MRETVKKLAGLCQKVRLAQMLLKTDAAGPGWTGARFAEAFDSCARTIEKLRERFVTEGFASTLDGKPRDKPPTAKLLKGNFDDSTCSDRPRRMEGS